MTPKIRLRGLSKSFGPKRVLDGIDLDIMPGTSMVVIGGSGSGKSVLLKCILGLIEPDEGSIEIDHLGFDATGGHVFQNANIHGQLSLHDLAIRQRSTSLPSTFHTSTAQRRDPARTMVM